MATRPIGVRFSAEGGAQVVGEAERIGRAGDEAMQKIKRASEPASAGLKAIDAAAGQAREAADRLADSAGGLGGVLTALGPAGFGVTAAVGGLIALAGAGKDAAASIAEVGQAADRLQIDPALFERLRAALTLEGQRGLPLEEALIGLQQRLGEAAREGGAAREQFAALGVEVGGPLDIAIRQLADGLAAIPDPAQRVAVASQLMGDAGAGLVTILGEGTAALDAQFAAAERVGLLYGGDLIRASQAVTAQIETQTAIIETRWNVALVRNAELWLTAQRAALGFYEVMGRALSGGVDTLEISEASERARREMMGGEGWRPLNPEAAPSVAPLSPVSSVSPIIAASSGRASAPAPMRAPPTPFDAALDRADVRMRDLTREADTFGMAKSAAAAYRLEQDLLAAAQEQYGEVTEATRGLIAVYVEDLRAAGAQVEALTAQQKAEAEAAQRTAQTYDQMGQALSRYAGQLAGAEDAGRAFLGVLAEIAAQGLTGTGPFGSLANQLLGGAGGLVGAAVGAFAAPSTAGVDAFVTGGLALPRRAAGGPVEAGRWYMTGELGPEPVMFGAAGRVLSNEQARDALAGPRGGGVSISVDARGSTDPALVEAAALRGAMAALSRVGAITADERRRGRA